MDSIVFVVRMAEISNHDIEWITSDVLKFLNKEKSSIFSQNHEYYDEIMIQKT